eukprot:COSAG01_NODE_771_length_13718_cov_54.441442_12_plen_92_part_00
MCYTPGSPTQRTANRWCNKIGSEGDLRSASRWPNPQTVLQSAPSRPMMRVTRVDGSTDRGSAALEGGLVYRRWKTWLGHSIPTILCCLDNR